MSEASTLGAISAFAAGAVSFLSPCVLPLVPAYMSYVTGQSLAAGAGGAATVTSRLSAASMSLFFVLGFSAVFIALGASATALSRMLLQYRYEAGIAGGALVALFGLVMLVGVERIPFLRRDAHFHLRTATANPASAFALGLAFGFGWTPCIGPILSGILAIAATRETVAQGMTLLLVYSLGLGIPFVLTGFAVTRFMRFFVHYKKHIRTGEIVAGALLIGIGLLIFLDRLSWLNRFTPKFLERFLL